MLVAGLVWCVLRAPLGAAIGLDDLFSPAMFHRAVLKPVAASPGNLMVTAAGILLFAMWLWGWRAPRRWWMVGLGLLLLLGAPYLVTDLSRGILPPARASPRASG